MTVFTASHIVLLLSYVYKIKVFQINKLQLQAGGVEEKDKDDEGVVYAELDLTHAARPPPTPVVVCDDKTEYAEIIHSQPPK